MDIGSIKIEDYNYTLPDEKIAKFPLKQRDMSKLLVYRNEAISETGFVNLAENLNKDSLLVFNNTRVIHARLEFRRVTGARIEVLCIEPHQPSDYDMMFREKGECSWWCMVGNLKKWKTGLLQMQVITSEGEVILLAEKIKKNENATLIKFKWNIEITFGELIEVAGTLPLPPYLNRRAIDNDRITYQTVYSQIEGSVASPTAGLHFTESVFASLKKKKTECAFLTLHVGAGTFKPVKSDSISKHEMHNEHFYINDFELEKIINKKGKLIAVGTTSVRTIESLYWLGVKTIVNPEIEQDKLVISQWENYGLRTEIDGLTALKSLSKWIKKHKLTVLHSATSIMIVPGYQFRLVDIIITNFHQPKSTLLLLISAWVGEDWKRIYKYALENDFRFLSYGDSSLLFRSVNLMNS